MRKTSTPASHKRRIRCGACEAGPSVATIFTRRRRRMLSPSRIGLIQRDAVGVYGYRLGCVCTYDEYATRVEVCTDGSRQLAGTQTETKSVLHLWSTLSTDARQNCLSSIVRGRAIMVQSTPESAQSIG